MKAQHWMIGDVRVTRVSYFDIGLPPAVISLEAADLQRLSDSGVDITPWIDESGQPLVGQSFLVVESDDQTIVVDPCGASDAFLRTGPEALTHQDAAFAAFSDAGFDRRTVDTVFLSHLDGIGMAAWATNSGWEPAFPNADIVVSKLERQAISDNVEISGRDAFEELDALGAVRTVDLPYLLTDDITLTHSGVHTAGHVVATISSNGHKAALLGHLAISPLHLHEHVPALLHIEPENAPALVAEWVEFAATSDAVLFGPLWPAPGAVRVVAGTPTRLIAAPATS